MQLEDWLDDLCVRFIINLPPEELASVERICFQVEEAQWFYEDFVRPLDPSLPSLSLKQFSLRIFQHCPLFSQWSAQHHTTAFAEFLAYKQRVPVRGAIMLSEAMDEVVLVKGWKKGANWSFPRGKINKDENDLDCAIREVYEETGFDVRAAGLAKSEKETKYIEVTMREQHMRLYVFRGVPKETHFEPRTRKEISKIEWYKLHDLPTLKKRTHQENDDQPAINANKFYMVAPFLHPLKKWIAQQKKKEIRYGGTGLAVPPVLAEESATENESYQVGGDFQHNAFSPPAVSNLPEVLPTQQSFATQDPSTHLKELLKIGNTGPTLQIAPEAVGQQNQFTTAEATKSNALLALLRNGPSNTSQGQQPQPLVQQSEYPPGFVRSPEPRQLEQSPQTSLKPLPPYQSAPMPESQQRLLQMFSKVSQITQPQPATTQNAPYQLTGDPEFAMKFSHSAETEAVPSAHALPKLTHHTRALLDAFHTKNSAEDVSEALLSRPQTQMAPQQQSLLNAFKQPTQARSSVPATMAHQNKEVSSLTELPSQSPVPRQQPIQSANLLELFARPAGNPPTSVVRTPGIQHNVPAELAAAPVESPKPQAAPSQDDFLAALFRKDKPPQPVRQRSPVAKIGQTGATVSGPLNEPNLATIAKSAPAPTHDLKRSSVPASRVLYDPKNPAPVKILARPESKSTHEPRSPRNQKSQANVASPKKQSKTQEKLFQPQILRRPQVPESRQSLTPSPSSLAPAGSLATSRRPSNLNSSSPLPKYDQLMGISPPPIASPRRVSGQSDSHKQTLLQLFGGTTPTATAPMLRTSSKQTMMSPGTVSPIMQSHVVSPITDEPVSTRSRVGSLASIVSGDPGPAIQHAVESRPKVEKRQTTAEDKAFLLNYLGKFANQEN